MPGGESILASLNVVDDADITAPGELGLSQEAFQQFGLAEGSGLTVAHARPPQSLHAVLCTARIRLRIWTQQERSWLKKAPGWVHSQLTWKDWRVRPPIT